MTGRHRMPPAPLPAATTRTTAHGSAHTTAYGSPHTAPHAATLAATLADSLAVVLAAGLAFAGAAPRVAAQDPTPTPAPRWHVYLPVAHRPPPTLYLVPEVLQMGGTASGIAVEDGVVYQAHGGTLASWLPTGVEADWAYQGGLHLLDAPAVREAWVTADGGVATFLRQIELAVDPATAPILRLSLFATQPDGAWTAGANLDLDGRLAGDARVGHRLHLSVVDGDGANPALVSVEVGDWHSPAIVDRQPLTAPARHLLELPEIDHLVAVGQGDSGPELWSWSVRDGVPRAEPPAPLPSGSPAALIRVPEGVLALDRGGNGLVIPLRAGKPRPREARAVVFDLAAVPGPGGRIFAAVDAAAFVAGQVCLYHGVYVSPHAATRAINNLLACFDLPAGGSPVPRRVLAADPLIDAAGLGRAGVSAVHLAVAGDRLLLSRGSAAGIEVFSPLAAGDGAVRTLDAAPGRVKAVLRAGDRLITAEADAQLRAWAFEAAPPWGLRPLGRVGLPAAGMLITRDLPPAAPGATPADLVLWRERGLAVIGRLQRVRLGADPPFQPLAGEEVLDMRFGLRAAGNLLWVPGEGRMWRYGASGTTPLTLPGIEDTVQDVAVAVAGDLRYLAAGSAGLVVLGAGDQVLGRLPLPGPASAVAVDAADAATTWVATGGRPGLDPGPRGAAALHAIDVTQPETPRLVASVDLPGDRVDRLRAAGGRVAGSGWQRRAEGVAGIDDPLLFLVDARDRAHPRVEGATAWNRPPDFLAPPYAEPRLGWDLAPDGRRLYAARDGLAVYALVVAP